MVNITVENRNGDQQKLDLSTDVGLNLISTYIPNNLIW